MQTTAIRTVAKSLPQNKVILLTCLISNSYIPYTDLQKNLGIINRKQKNNLWGLEFGDANYEVV